ncbi:MFS transporter [Rufibacter hautae]|uniref:MFS transporter n=1 Tax=Rufibacter hautae TaxID=2595005 RepID=A0A5B6TT22_9BACT|nr:MFS transporter [Rufibacter hautae]KAA3439648.1 MFS transporter [Rufibacter hautae]
MIPIVSLYRNAFRGLSREVWYLAAVTFINRSGAMVVPFLSVYLTESLGFNIKQVGVLLSLYGVGATIGNFWGGWLTDRLGHFKVQLGSYVLTGLWLVVVPFLQRFEWVAGGLLLLSILTETLRPANESAVSAFSAPQQVTRAFSLNRLAINLGFSLGPALGGLLATLSYKWIFLADSFTCLTAGLAFFLLFKNRKGTAAEAAPQNQPADSGLEYPASRSAYHDALFLAFAFLCCCYLVAFSQLFTTLTLFWQKVHHLSKAEIGGLLSLQGLLVIPLEMVIVYRLGKVRTLWKMIVPGLLLLAIACVLVPLAQGLPVLVLSVVFWSLSEIFTLPFTSTLTAQRSSLQNRGSYMGLYTLSYSVAFIVGPLAGTSTIDSFGFNALWWGCSALCVLTAVGFYLVVRRLQAPAEMDFKLAVPEPV